jgi:hypothetical protein
MHVKILKKIYHTILNPKSWFKTFPGAHHVGENVIFISIHQNQVTYTKFNVDASKNNEKIPSLRFEQQILV